MKKICVVLLLLLLLPSPVFAADDPLHALLSEQMDMLDFSAMQNVVDLRPYGQGFAFGTLVERAVRGELDLSPQGILTAFLSMLFREVRANMSLLRNLLVICLLSALLKNLTESFQNKGVGELGFYVCYMLLVTVLFSAFFTAASLASDVIRTLALLMQASIPLLISLMIMSGTVGAAAFFSPTLAFAVNTITIFVDGVLTPLIILSACIQIVSSMTEKQLLTNFAALLKNICTWGLRGIAAVFVAVLGLQRITAPILTNAAARSARAALSAAPVVGGVLNSAWDVVFVWAEAAKSGVMVAFIITIILACLAPALQMLALALLFKLTAALIQPICDERLITCLNEIGGFVFLLLGCLVTVMVMFILSVVILLAL